MAGDELIRPMLATAGPLPTGPDWAYEFKWDGVRLVTYVRDGQVRAMTRNDREVSASYPELAVLAELWRDGRLVLDGEVVALAAGRPHFGQLQNRMHVVRPDPALLRRVPVVYYVFDVLAVSGQDTLALPYLRRRELLDKLDLTGPGQLRVPASFVGVHGPDVLATAREHGLEGVVAKRVDSRYEPGRRSRNWVKVPLVRTQEVLVCGWQPGEGRRANTVGSLLLGAPAPGEPAGRLVYLGHVGTGFTDADLRHLHDLLRPLATPTSPFHTPVPRDHSRRAHWVRPELVGEVEYRQITADGMLRHASWRGLREDKNPDEVVAPGG